MSRLNICRNRNSVSEAAKKLFFFSGPTTKRGRGVKDGPLRLYNLFKSSENKSPKKCDHHARGDH